MDAIYRLGILSDTHLKDLGTALELAQQLLAGPFSGVDAILHAGDMVIAEFESCFGEIPVYSVQGNMDAGRASLPRQRILHCGGYKIGLIHGWGPPAEVPHNVRGAFAEDALDILVFGHSHTPYNSCLGKTLLFNPGSATEHRGRAGSCTVGVIELGREISARHIAL